MIRTSETAIKKLREQLVDKCLEAGIGFRIYLDSNKAHETIFSIRIDEQRQGDQVIKSNGIKIFLAPDVASQINNFELDYSDKDEDIFLLKPSTILKTNSPNIESR